MNIAEKKNTIMYTVGHSTLTWEDFIEMLHAFGVQKLIDVRSYPGSRYVPHFGKEILLERLRQNGILYSHMPALGGRRKSVKEEDYMLVQGWSNPSFQNYASYTLTAEYEEAVKALIVEAKKQTIAIMCAESVPWKCHRSILSNTLVANGVKVYHIMDKNTCVEHVLNRYGARAVFRDGKIVYPKSESN